MEPKIDEQKSTVKRIGGILHKVFPVVDVTGEIISYTLKPLMVEFKPRDILQIVVGSSILAIPVAFTGEVWELAETLPMNNIIALATISVIFIAAFVFFNFYKNNFREHIFSFFKRVIFTYLISLAIVAIVLTIIDKCPWGIDNYLAIKRIIMVAFPASMSGTLSDTLK